MRHYGWTPQDAKALSVQERMYWLEVMIRRNEVRKANN